MKKLLVFTSLVEFSLGISLVIVPSIVLKLLFGIEDSKSITALSQLTGIVFLCFAIACFPSKNSTDSNINASAFKAMFLYNILAAVYLGYMKFAEQFDGILLFPAVILHSMITIYFVIIRLKNKKTQ